MPNILKLGCVTQTVWDFWPPVAILACAPCTEPMLELSRAEAPALASRWEPLPQSPSKGQVPAVITDMHCEGKREIFLVTRLYQKWRNRRETEGLCTQN